jgi:hypothetical protein
VTTLRAWANGATATAARRSATMKRARAIIWSDYLVGFLRVGNASAWWPGLYASSGVYIRNTPAIRGGRKSRPAVRRWSRAMAACQAWGMDGGERAV